MCESPTSSDSTLCIAASQNTPLNESKSVAASLVQEQVDYKIKENPLTVCYRRSEVFSLDLISLQPRAKLIGILA